MRTITPTLALCATAFAGAIVALAIPADAPPRPSAPASGAPASVGLVIESFNFGAPTVPANTVVAVVNRDSVEHTVTADDGSFDITIAPGGTAPFVTPSTPGTYAFVCLIHPSMSASIVVT